MDMANKYILKAEIDIKQTNQIFKQNKIHHSIVLTLVSDMVVVYGNDAFSILVL